MKTVLALVMGLVLLPSLNHANSYQANTFVNYIPNFSQLLQAVENGSEVRAIIHFNKCLVSSPDSQEEVNNRLEFSSTGFKFTHFFHAKENVNERLVDSVSTFKKMIIESPSGEWLTLFSRLSVFEDNTARLRIVAYESILNKKRWVVDWNCTLNAIQNGFQPILQSNFQSTMQSNFQNNAQETSSTILENNKFQNPLQNNFQENNGLVLFSY